MQVVLQAADVGLADAQVMQQVAGAVAVMGLDRLDVGCVRRFERDCAVAQVAQLGKRALDETVGGHQLGAGGRPCSLGPEGDGIVAVDGDRDPDPYAGAIQC